MCSWWCSSKYVGPSLNSLSQFSKNVRISLYKIENSSNLWKLWDFFHLLFLIRAGYKTVLRVAISYSLHMLRIQKMWKASHMRSSIWDLKITILTIFSASFLSKLIATVLAEFRSLKQMKVWWCSPLVYTELQRSDWKC